MCRGRSIGRSVSIDGWEDHPCGCVCRFQLASWRAGDPLEQIFLTLTLSLFLSLSLSLSLSLYVSSHSEFTQLFFGRHTISALNTQLPFLSICLSNKLTTYLPNYFLPLSTYYIHKSIHTLSFTHFLSLSLCVDPFPLFLSLSLTHSFSFSLSLSLSLFPFGSLICLRPHAALTPVQIDGVQTPRMLKPTKINISKYFSAKNGTNFSAIREVVIWVQWRLLRKMWSNRILFFWLQIF